MEEVRSESAFMTTRSLWPAAHRCTPGARRVHARCASGGREHGGDWSTDDLVMLSGLFVDVMIAAIEAMLEATAGAPLDRPSGEAEAEISTLTERRMRLIALAIPQWRSAG
jgi:hypothetical protein